MKNNSAKSPLAIDLPASGGGMKTSPQTFLDLDRELDLATAIRAVTGRDLFAGVTDPETRKAAARVAIIVNKLDQQDASWAQRFERQYGEKLRKERAA